MPATQLQWLCPQCIRRLVFCLVLEESLWGPPQHQDWSLAWLLIACLLVDCSTCLHPKKRFLDWLECRQGLLPLCSLYWSALLLELDRSEGQRLIIANAG